MGGSKAFAWTQSPRPVSDEGVAHRQMTAADCRSTVDVWAHHVLAALDSPSDPRTLGDWARAVGASRGALRSCCYAAGVSPRLSLDLSRLMRAVNKSASVGWPAESFLHVADSRSVTALLRRTGVSKLAGMTLERLLATQRVVSPNGPHIDSIRHLLRL